ncbi:MAG TPA: hypothetical protein DCE42_24000 [Myxococcales bacterium]|nr:hypothetical protein [Deltaproteobacteria bacterium]HAA57851.1 hypothetical protein [Myxococcales bacterium]
MSSPSILSQTLPSQHTDMLLLWCTNICRVGNLVGVLWHLNLWFIIYHITRLNRCVHIQALFLMATLMARCQSLLGQVATCGGSGKLPLALAGALCLPWLSGMWGHPQARVPDTHVYSEVKVLCTTRWR